MKYSQFSKSDILAFRQSCQIASQTFETIKKLIRPGLTEKEIAGKIVKIMKSLGSQGLAFRPIVACGNHSATPHHRPTTRKVKKNDIVLLDFGCKMTASTSEVTGGLLGGERTRPMFFCSDLSRTIFIGTPKPQWQKVYQIVQTAQRKIIKQLNNETMKQYSNSFRLKSLDSIARSYIKSKGYGKNFTHSLGHGIGSQLHQYFSIGPKSRAYLKPNMVFTIEPGIYLKNKFGVRIEDIVYLGPKKVEILTK